MVNQYYIYAVDRDFGPFFIKFSSYFPYNGRLCINGHEYAKRQLQQRGIGYEALDNGFLNCEDLEQLQAICDGLGPVKIDNLLRKWLAFLPHPYMSTTSRTASSNISRRAFALPSSSTGPTGVSCVPAWLTSCPTYLRKTRHFNSVSIF